MPVNNLESIRAFLFYEQLPAIPALRRVGGVELITESPVKKALQEDIKRCRETLRCERRMSLLLSPMQDRILKWFSIGEEHHEIATSQEEANQRISLLSKMPPTLAQKAIGDGHGIRANSYKTRYELLQRLRATGFDPLEPE